MKTAREIARKGLEARMSAKINVRQPLSRLSVRKDPPGKTGSNGKSGKAGETSGSVMDDLVYLVSDEVNVRHVVFTAGQVNEVELDTVITPELKEEGDVRELLRKIQDIRKEKGLKIGDGASLVATNDLKDLISRHEREIMKATNLSGIEYGDALGIK
jgi:isoleucyl-tRNA synthetase